jgi:hypothetical protein
MRVASIFSAAVSLTYRPRPSRTLRAELARHELDGSKHKPGSYFSELRQLLAQFADFVAAGLALGVAGQALLAGFQEILGSSVVQVGRESPPRLTTDVLDRLLC